MHLLAVCTLLIALSVASSFLITAGLGGRTTSNVKMRGVISTVNAVKPVSPVTRLAGKLTTQIMLSGGAWPVSAVQTPLVAAGWDLYGRVPHDEWLFATHKLVDKDILKKSFVEAIQQELPITLAHFNRRKTIHTALMITKGVIGVFTGLALLGWIVMATTERMRKDKVLEMELRGFSTPISASYKGAQQVGRAVEGNPDWIDLSRRNQNREDDERRRKEEEEEADENDTEERDDERGGDRDGGRDLPKATGGSDRTSGGNSGGQQPGPSNGNTGTGRKPPPPSKGAGKSDGKGRDSESKNTGTSKRKGKRDEGGPEDDYSDIND